MCVCPNLDRVSIALSARDVNKPEDKTIVFIFGKRKVLFTFSMGHETADREHGSGDNGELEDSAGNCYGKEMEQ
jgi:hypothetical protein